MHFLITAGGTREYIDPVRFISNASSGKMGLALARAVLTAGHKATLISAAELPVPVKAKIIHVNTAHELFAAVKKHFPACDCLIMAAAVADYTPVNPSKTKLKKANKSLTIKLKPTVDILKWTASHKKKNQKVIGFALEDKDLKLNAEKKLKTKNLDMIIANTPAAIGAQASSIQIKTPSTNWVTLSRSHKNRLARKLVSFIENLFA